MAKRILLMYISEHSGHHQASIALEKALLKKDPGCNIRNINAFHYTSPLMEKMIHKLYLGVVKKHPQVWGYLYDNPDVVKKTSRLRRLLNRAGSKKIGNLIAAFRPDAIACTQALPCTLVSEYKKRRGDDTPLIGILTDYAPHSYWIHNGVDAYIVPSADTGEALIRKGVARDKIKALGTPIDPSFTAPIDKRKVCERCGLSMKEPIILVMGGTHGIGPDEKLIRALLDSKKKFQIVVVTGVNKKLLHTTKKMGPESKKKLLPLGFVHNVHELMGISDLIVTKPGGMTTAEALAMTLPMIIVNPLPGQEHLNTKKLIQRGLAARAEDGRDAARLAEELLDDRGRLRKMRKAMRAEAKPSSAADVAQILLQLAG